MAPTSGVQHALPALVGGTEAILLVEDEEMVRRYMQEAMVFSQERPVLIDRFLEDATEVDVDALCDTDGNVLLAGIMEHIEEAGVHSGDSSCVLPSTSLSQEVLDTIKDYTHKLARALNVDVKSIKRRRMMLEGVCPEVVDLLKDRSISIHTIEVLRKMKPMRRAR